MNLELIPRGETLILDANILIYAIQQESKQCKRLLMQCAGDEINGVLPLHILSEVMHVLMISEAIDNGWVQGLNKVKQLAEKPERIKSLFRYENLIKDIFAINLNLVSLQHEDFISAMRIQREFGLMTNDALFIAVAERLRIKTIVSADKALASIRGMILYSPDDIQ